MIFSRCGHSVLTWPNRVSIHAWSVGVPGRPKRAAMEQRARNSLVEPARIWGPLSDIASRIGSSSLSSASAGAVGLAGLDGGPQALGVEGLCEDDLYLGGGLLGGDEGGEPFAGDDVEDGVGDPAGSGEMGDVINPDLVAPPFDPVRQGPRRRRGALRAGGQNKPLTSENAIQRRR